MKHPDTMKHSIIYKLMITTVYIQTNIIIIQSSIMIIYIFLLKEDHLVNSEGFITTVYLIL